jgi:hypothetical protein
VGLDLVVEPDACLSFYLFPAVQTWVSVEGMEILLVWDGMLELVVQVEVGVGAYVVLSAPTQEEERLLHLQHWCFQHFLLY